MALSKDDVIKLVNEFIQVLRQRHDIREVYLFGSFAKGMAKEYSDVDLAVVLGSLDKSIAPPYDEHFKIFHEAQRYNSLLEVVCLNKEEFEQDGGALVRQIKKEGIRLL
ncbi:MAG: nucleotidyltransferase domain-containing protein [Deltaproteobacteria bacterium]|jgi:predicted nucleotidyltransferase|nr:nucleotidyltransferase domain-containing protein [Deltaproteobacteria bacterium]